MFNCYIVYAAGISWQLRFAIFFSTLYSDRQRATRIVYFMLLKSLAKTFSKILSCFLCLKSVCVCVSFGCCCDLVGAWLVPVVGAHVALSHSLFIPSIFVSSQNVQCLQFEISGDTIECKHYFKGIFCLSPLDLTRFDSILLYFVVFEIYFCSSLCCVVYIHSVHGELILGITINGKCVDGWLRGREKKSELYTRHTERRNLFVPTLWLLIISKTSYSLRQSKEANDLNVNERLTFETAKETEKDTRTTTINTPLHMVEKMKRKNWSFIIIIGHA